MSIVANAQTASPKRVGLLMGLAAHDPEGQARVAAFRRTIRELGWTEGGNLQVDYRWAAGDVERTRQLARELVETSPDVIVVNTPPGLAALRQATHTIPIVFVQVLEAMETNVVVNPARPESNVTGFTTFFGHNVSGKWLELLKEVVPTIIRVAVMQNPNHPSWQGYLTSLSRIAPGMGVQIVPAPLYTPDDIDKVVARVAHDKGGGLMVLPDTFNTVHRDRIVNLTADYRLPAIYPSRFFTIGGGLMSYGADLAHLLRQAGTYVDRILKGATIADLPVQQSTKLELVINLKVAAALGFPFPPTLLATADEVIE
jgi:putative ABC transport system substrate-binding protein